MKRNKNIILLASFITFGCLTLNPQNFNNINCITKLDTRKELSYIKIASKEDLIDLISKSYTDEFSANTTYKLVSDIDFEGETINPIPIFSGVLDGNNHTIKNFKVDTSYSGDETGFIRVLTKTGVVKNLNLEGTIEVNNDDTAIGGIVGTNNGIIDNCSYSGEIKGRHIAGGIAGINEKDATIINSINNGHIEAKMFTAGICGLNKGKIESAVNNGVINDSKFSSTDEITLSNIGGITGFNQGSIIGCVNNNDVGQKQLGTFVGGICGTSIGQVTNCSNCGIVKGNTNIGGIIGSFAEFSKQESQSFNDLIDIIKSVISNHNKSLENNEIVPLATDENSSLKYCLNSGFVSGGIGVGGIAGYSANPLNTLNKRVFDINNCVNQAAVEGSKDSLGGIVGNQLNGKIYECFNVGNIQGKTADNVGGIVGQSGGEVAYSFAINDMIGNKYVGGIAGFGSSIHDCYTICKIDAKDNYIGAIAGDIEDKTDSVYKNYYVNDDFYGIDNIDSENKSLKKLKSELASSTILNVNLDSEFFSVDNNKKTFPILTSFLNLNEDIFNNKELKNIAINTSKFGSYVNFINEDGVIIKKIFVEYNQDLDLNEIPEVPQKDGCFAKWSEFNPQNIITNLYIKPIYDEIITTIASSSGPTPSVLVEGKFYSTTKLKAFEKDINILDSHSVYTYVKTVTINLYDDINNINFENITYKISLPNKYEKPCIAIKDGEKLKILDSKIDGRYITFKAEDAEEYYLLDKKFVNWHNPGFIATISVSIIGGVALISGITFGIIKHKKNKKLKNS